MFSNFKTRAAAVAAAIAAPFGAAHAALPEGVTTAITSYQTDAVSAIGLIMAAGVVIWGAYKLAQKMRWI